MFRYFETKVDHFAPYLLKDGLVQKVTKYENNLPEADEVGIEWGWTRNRNFLPNSIFVFK